MHLWINYYLQYVYRLFTLMNMPRYIIKKDTKDLVLSTRVTIPVSEKLRLIAKKEGLNLSQVIEEAVLRFVEEESV